MDALELLVPAVSTFGGVALGWWLGARTAKDTAREEREWQDRRAVRERQDAAAARLDEDLIEVLKVMPQVQMPAKDAIDPLANAHSQLRLAWARATVLADQGIGLRMVALDGSLFIATQYSRENPDKAHNYWPLAVAMRDVRKALAAFQRHEEPPNPDYPDPGKLVEMSYDEKNRDLGLMGIMSDLLKRRVSP